MNTQSNEGVRIIEEAFKNEFRIRQWRKKWNRLKQQKFIEELRNGHTKP